MKDRDIDATTQQLFQQYDRLGALWAKAEKTLGHVPHAVSVLAWRDDEGQHEIGIRRFQGTWRLCHCVSQAAEILEDWKPIVDCQVAIRVQAVHAMPPLFAAVVEAREQFAKITAGAIDMLQAIIADCAAGVDELAGEGKAKRGNL